MRGGVLDVIAIRQTAFLLVHRMHQPGRHAAFRRADVKFAEQHRLVDERVNFREIFRRRLPAVFVQAVNVETLCEPDDVIRRCAAEADAEVEMIRVGLFDGGIDDRKVAGECAEHELTAAFRRVAARETVLEMVLHFRRLALKNQLNELAFAARPRRFVADEIAEQIGVVLVRSELAHDFGLDLFRKTFGIHIRQAHDRVAALKSAQREDVRLVERSFVECFAQAGAVGGVEPPGIEAARGELCPVGAPVVAVAALEVRAVKIRQPAADLTATAEVVCNPGQWLRHGGEQIFAPRDARADAKADAVDAGRIKQMTIGINKPPAPVNLLDAEKSGGFRLRGGEAAEGIAVGKGGAQFERVGFGRPDSFQVGFRVRFAGPVGVGILAKLVNQRFAFQHRVAGVVRGQRDRADFERWRAGGITHGHAHALDVGGRTESAGFDVDPIRIARLVHRRRQIGAVAESLPVKPQRNGRAHPDAGERMNALGDGFRRHRQAEFEPLAGGRAKFDDEKIISRPIGRQIGIDFFQRPFVGGNGFVERDGFNFSSVRTGRGQPCRGNNCGCDPATADDNGANVFDGRFHAIGVIFSAVA